MIQTGRASGGRIMAPMTRTQTRTYGVSNPSTRQPLLEAMLRAFCWLMSNVGSTLRTISNRPTRDWHTGATSEDQRPKSNDITQEGAQPLQPSFSGKAAGRIPRIPVVSTQGQRRIPASLSTKMLGTSPSMTPLVLSHLEAWNTRSRRRPGSSQRATRATLQTPIPIIPGEGASRRRPGTQVTRTACHPGSRAAAIRDPFIRSRICKMVPGSRCAWPG
jgi:hypothetical protein